MPPDDASISVAKSILQAIFLLFSLWIVGLGYLAREHHNNPDDSEERWLARNLATGLSMSSFILYLSFITIMEVLRNQASNGEIGLSITLLEVFITSCLIIGLRIIVQIEPMGIGDGKPLPLWAITYISMFLSILFGLYIVFVL